MKPVIRYILSVLILGGTVTSCEDTVPVEQEIPEISLNLKSEEIIRAEKIFGFELFREVFAVTEEKNIMISPMSVSYALGMTYNGTAGMTLQAFIDVLHFGDLTEQEVNQSYKDLMDQLINLDDKVEISIANSIWYCLGFEVLSEFIETNHQYFDAEVKEADFSDPGTVDVINHWIEDKTNDKIKDMLDCIPANVVMYLINAIYFNATWKYQFEKDKTYEGDFTLAGGTNHRTDYISRKGMFCYTENIDFTAVEIPYGDSTFSMVVMLPAEGKDIAYLVEKLGAENWNSWFDDSWYTRVKVDLPRFKYEFKDSLNDPLIALGLGVAFSGAADFTRINPTGNLFISRVIHQTFIDVQEEGTEAAAATIVELAKGGGGPYFKADRPFLYVIKENSTGAIVFIGKVGKPEYS